MASLAGLFGNNKGFNAATVEPTVDFQPIPAGNYKAIISSSSVDQAKSGNGTNLVLEFKIIDGEHKNRTIRTWLCVQHPSQQTQEIAQRQFSAVCHAVGQIQVTSTEQLHSKPLLIRVSLEPDNREEGRMQNRIKGYMPLQKAATPEPAMAGDGDFDDDAPF